MAKVLVALSGGVDSSVATAVVLQQGHQVVGAYMKNWINDEGLPGDCPWEQDIADAYAVAQHLGIEFRVIDLVEQYRARVVDYLVAGYKRGITPNPDVMCNREMKFGVFLDYAIEQGFDFVATGHYARVCHHDDGTADILRGRDPNKDQSYFLSLMLPHQVERVLFPIGDMLKPAVRQMAQAIGLPTASKKDSQGICFIGQIKMADFLRHHIPDNPGNIVDRQGRVLGQHQGLHFFTIGQRKGHGVASPKCGIAYVVIDKCLQANELVVGYEDESAHELFSTRAVVGGIVNTRIPLPLNVLAQPRYRAMAEPAECHYLSDTTVELTFAHPVRALALGQVCAFYQGGTLLGGGFFEQVSPS